MNLRHVVTCGVLCAVFAMAGCDKGRTDPADASVRVVNVAPSFATLSYIREHVGQPSELGYRESTTEFLYDVDTYDFYVSERALLPTSTPRLWTFNRTLQGELSYTFVLTEVAGEVQPVILEQPKPPATESQIMALHAAEGVPALDFYLERPGVGIAGATPRGTIGVQQSTAPQSIPTGEYELFVTEAGNPANLLLTSQTITLAAGANATFVVAAEPAFAQNTISVVLMQGAASVVLYDRNRPASRLRAINGVTDGVPRDLALGSQFSPPLFSAIPFAAPTAYVDAPIGAAQALNVTPVGNPGVLELDQTYTGSPLQQATLLFGGEPGALRHVVSYDDGRRIQNEAKLMLASAASQFTTGLDFILTTPGADPTNLFGDAVLIAPNTTLGYLPLAPGELDLYLRITGTTNMAAGPIRLTVASRGIYGVLAINGPDTATAEVVLFDDFP